MKRGWPIVLAAAASGLALYGLLLAVQPAPTRDEDPWLRAWAMGGMKAQFRSFSTSPAEQFALRDARPLMARPDFDGTTLRDYHVQSLSAQVAEFPSAALLAKEIPEGRHLEFRLDPGNKKSGVSHVCRVGRRVLLVSTRVSAGGFFVMPAPVATVERIFDLFPRAAEGRP
jgi:hypothetical protein